MSIIKGQVQDGDMIDVHNRRRQKKKRSGGRKRPRDEWHSAHVEQVTKRVGGDETAMAVIDRRCREDSNESSFVTLFSFFFPSVQRTRVNAGTDCLAFNDVTSSFSPGRRRALPPPQNSMNFLFF